MTKTSPLQLLVDKRFSSIALSHLLIDMLNGQRSILLAYLSVPLGLTNTALGAISTVYSLAAALAQVIFGYVADKLGARWVVAGGVIWMAAFFSLALVTPGYAAVVLLIVGSMGSGAFHSGGAMQATSLAHLRMPDRETAAASFFFVFGQLGFFFGPLMGGWMLEQWGPLGLLSLSAVTVLMGANAAWQLGVVAPQESAAAAAKPAGRSVSLAVVLVLVAVTALQSWVSQGITTFVPKYLSDLNYSATEYGILSALFMGGAALGNLIGGQMSDCYGRTKVILVAMSIAAPPTFLIGAVTQLNWLYLIIPLAGVASGSAFSAIIVLAQRVAPTGQGLASGLALALVFSSGALGVTACGWVVDRWGFAVNFYLLAGLSLLAGLLAPLLDKEREN